MQTPNFKNLSRPFFGVLSIAIITSLTVSSSTLSAADGKALYKKKCASCHGTDGKGRTKIGKKLKCRDLSSAAVQAKITDAAIAKSITDGISNKGKVVMKPIKMSTAEIAAVTKYVRTLKK